MRAFFQFPSEPENNYNTTIPWLLSATRNNSRRFSGGIAGHESNPSYYLL